jgi:hypothetical protein
MTVSGYGFGDLSGRSMALRASGTNCEATFWVSETSVKCQSGSALKGSNKVTITQSNAAASLTTGITYDAASFFIQRTLQGIGYFEILNPGVGYVNGTFTGIDLDKRVYYGRFFVNSTGSIVSAYILEQIVFGSGGIERFEAHDENGEIVFRTDRPLSSSGPLPEKDEIDLHFEDTPYWQQGGINQITLVNGGFNYIDGEVIVFPKSQRNASSFKAAIRTANGTISAAKVRALFCETQFLSILYFWLARVLCFL